MDGVVFVCDVTRRRGNREKIEKIALALLSCNQDQLASDQGHQQPKIQLELKQFLKQTCPSASPQLQLRQLRCLDQLHPGQPRLDEIILGHPPQAPHRRVGGLGPIQVVDH